MLAHASRSVARFRAVTIYGELETGELVTLVDANDHGGLGLFHEYISSASVIGAHVSPEQTYRAVRFRLDDPFYTNHLRDGDASEVSDDGSVLRVETSQRGNWLVYESSEPATLRQLDIRVFSSCRALAQLALAIQVAQTAAGCWLAPPPHFGSATCALWSESWWPTSP